MDSTFKTLSDAAKRQLSGSKPALLIAGFNGLSDEQLRSLARQDHDGNQLPTALAIKVSRFLNTDYRDHVVGVGFLSRGVLGPSVNGIVNTGGAAYYFPKRESSFWQEDFNKLF